MKIRNLLVLAITIALGTLCAQAQERDGSMSFTDHLKQGITISRFGTVLSFKNSRGREIEANNTYKVCLCGSNSCIESVNVPPEGTSAVLKVEFPKQGAAIENGQTLIVTATVRGSDLTVTRQLAWVAGSSVVNIDETISASSAVAVCSFTEIGRRQLVYNHCPGPPGKCPPKIRAAPRVTSGKFELIRRFPLPLRFMVDYHLLK